MSLKQLVVHIEREIARLQEARDLLSGESSPVGRGGSKVNGAPAAKKRTLSPENRQKIADGMKRRWAARRRAAGTKAAK